MSNGAVDLLVSVAAKLPAGQAIAQATKIQVAALGKLDRSIGVFTRVSSTQTKWLIALTVALLVCTVVLIGLTVALLVQGATS
ncbi:MAG: hypothetical protein F4137_10190 [Acidobacteria bacterium]|nr:hypothetical protein [Acidobacteriota bacterium]MYH29205.1 hypothetical protein [Acidobacteriota bacterium]